MSAEKIQRNIGTLNEKPLHEALKRWYARSADTCEAEVEGFIVDIVRDDLLIEIQTRNFGAIRRKLEKLLEHHRVRLVYPIAGEKWIIKLADDGDEILSRRKSPKRCDFHDVFNELIRLTPVLVHPNFSLDLLLIREEEVRKFDGVRGWRRSGWITHERRLLEVVERRSMESRADIEQFIPPGLAEPFTTSGIAEVAGIPRRLAQRMVYCLRSAGCIVPAGKQGHAFLYTRRPVV